MRATCLFLLLVVGLVSAARGILVASEADEIRQRVKAMRKEAETLAEKGHKDEAARVEKEAARLLQVAEQQDAKVKKHPEAGEKGGGKGAEKAGEKVGDKVGGKVGEKAGVHKDASQLKERLVDLLAQEKKLRAANASEKELGQLRELIARIERELHAHHAGGPVKKHPPELAAGAEKLEGAMRRIHHLRVAAENLKMAEVHELAQQLMEKAEAMEREVHEARQRLVAEARERAGAEHGPDVVRELREEVERLRAELRELRQQRDKR